MILARHFLLTVLMCSAAAERVCAQGIAPPPAQPVASPLSTWWYPLGNSEGTRHNVTPTVSQLAKDLVLKWRAPALANCPVILAGAIRTASPDVRQQIVGKAGAMVVMLSERGVVEADKHFGEELFPQRPYSYTLTGLFNTTASTPGGSGWPDAIGIGVDIAQRQRAIDPAEKIAGYLTDRTLTPQHELKIDSLPADPDLAANERAAVYPVAAFNNSAYTVVAQTTYRGSVSVANSVRKHALAGRDSLVWSYPIGPQPYPQQPAMTYDGRTIPPMFYFGVATAAYRNHIVRLRASPAAGVATSTDTSYAISIADSIADGTLRPVHIGTTAMPLATSGASELNPTSSYYVTLYSGPATSGEYFRIITEEHSVADVGLPRLRMFSAFSKDSASMGEFAAFAPEPGDYGISLVTADLDGIAPDRSGGGTRYLNNQGDEIVVALRNIVSPATDISLNRLYVLRRCAADTLIAGGPLTLRELVHTIPFAGRLMAAGDLVHDAQNRQELVIANGSEIRIVQLKDYNDIVFNGQGDVAKDYFTTLKQFTLDAAIVGVAIADLDGQGDNDLIVSTLTSTYAIGLRPSLPFGTIASLKTTYCQEDPLVFTWNRSVGGQDTYRLWLRDVASGQLFEQTQFSLDVDHTAHPLDAAAGPHTCTFHAQGVAPGRYQLIVQDGWIPALNDTSNIITIMPTAVTGESDNITAALGFDEPITFSANVECSDDLLLQSSSDGTNWTTEQSVKVVNGKAGATTTIPCPGDLCGRTDTVVRYFRLITPQLSASSPQRTARIPIAVEHLSIDDTREPLTRRRTVVWDPGAFACSRLELFIATEGSGTWESLAANLERATGHADVDIPDRFGTKVQLRLCCQDATAGICTYAASSSFEIPPPADISYVAPNPFNPQGPADAMIVFRPKAAGSVTVTIYDAAHAVVRRLLDGEFRDARPTTAMWDGRNSRGEYVASGTYICVIESGNDLTALPIIVDNR